jgi:hypothetical protein
MCRSKESLKDAYRCSLTCNGLGPDAVTESPYRIIDKLVYMQLYTKQKLNYST